MKANIVIYLWLILIVFFLPVEHSVAQDSSIKPDSVAITKLVERMDALQNALQYERDVSRQRTLTEQLIDDVKHLEHDPSIKQVVDRTKWMISIAGIMLHDYAIFKGYFEQLPVPYRDQLISSTSTELSGWSEGIAFALAYMENRTKEKKAELERLAEGNKSDKEYHNEEESYHYWLVGLCKMYILAGETVEVNHYLPMLQAYFGSQYTRLNEITATVTETKYGVDSTIVVLEKYISLSKFNEAMVTQLRRLYVQKNYTEDGFDEYLDKIKSTYTTMIQKELPNMEVKEKAPLFTLKNVVGEDVSLTGLKGKVVILDFWATWCGPCRASFPTMQELVNDYKKKGNDVEFLFIATGERGNRPDTLVMNYLNTTNYTFEVLLDRVEGSVSNAYRISGLPTKLIIDRNGFIRFKPSHRDDYYYMKKEMEAMIDYLIDEK